MKEFIAEAVSVAFWLFVAYKIYRHFNPTPEMIEKKAQKEKKLKEVRQAQAQEVVRKMDKKAEEEKDNIARCPKCGSPSITANQKGYGIGKAVIGSAVAGPIGLTAGNIGAKKVRCTCLKCGYQWWAGKK